MTITLAYAPEFSGVDIEVDDLDFAEFALIERSTNQISWTTVRGGAALEKAVDITLRHTFSVDSAGGWANADTGQACTVLAGPAADYSISTGKGRIALDTPGTTDRHVLTIAESVKDFDITAEMTVPATATGGAIATGLLGRVVDDNNFYMAQLLWGTAGTVTLELNKRVAGTFTTLVLASAFIAYTANVPLSARLQMSGTYLRAKLWDTATGEPADWTLVAFDDDAALTAAGPVGVYANLQTGNNNATPVTVTFDNLQAGFYGAQLTDYEFIPGVLNYYRVTPFGPPVFGGVGTADHDDNAAVTPGIPLGIEDGDQMFLFAACRNSGTGTVDAVAGWSSQLNFGNCRVFRKGVSGVEVAPTVTFSGTVAGVTTSAQICFFRGVQTGELGLVTSKLNASDQDIDFNGSTSTPPDDTVAILAGWKQDDWTSVAFPSGWTEIAEPDTTTGDDQGLCWAYKRMHVGADINADTIVVTGGTAQISRTDIAIYNSEPTDFTEQTATITPEIDAVWLKSVTRPFLNRPIQSLLDNPTRIVRPARTGVFNIKGRTLPVSVNDIRGSRRFTFKALTETAADTQTMDFVLAAGDVMLIQVPHGCTSPPAGYVTIGDTEGSYHPLRPDLVTWTLPCVEVAPPGPHVFANLATWETVLAQFATWDDVLAAFSTWQELLDTLVGDPSEVIVP